MEKVQEKLNKAIDLINSEDFNQAQVLLNEVIQIDENNIEAYKNLGLCEVNLDNPPAAIEAFEAAVKLDKNDALSLFYLANCYSRTGEKEKAIDNFEKVITLRPDYLDAYKSLAMIYIEFSQIENAIEIAKKAIENESIEQDGHVSRAVRHLRHSVGLHAQYLCQNHRVQEYGRLCNLCLLEILCRALKHNISNTKTEYLVCLLKHCLCLGIVLIQLFTHSRELCALTWEYISLFHNQLN